MSEMEEKIDKAIAVTRGAMLSRTLPDDIQKVAQSVLNLANVKVQQALFDMEEPDEELAFVLGRIKAHLDATALVQLTQAALCLTNSRVTLTGKPKQKKQGAGA